MVGTNTASVGNKRPSLSPTQQMVSKRRRLGEDVDESISDVGSPTPATRAPFRDERDAGIMDCCGVVDWPVKVWEANAGLSRKIAAAKGVEVFLMKDCVCVQRIAYENSLLVWSIRPPAHQDPTITLLPRALPVLLDTDEDLSKPCFPPEFPPTDESEEDNLPSTALKGFYSKVVRLTHYEEVPAPPEPIVINLPWEQTTYKQSVRTFTATDGLPVTEKLTFFQRVRKPVTLL